MDQKNIDTKSLWVAFLSGDDNAFAGIYYVYINPLLSYGKKLSHDRDLLHDAIQEIFIDIYQKRSKLHIPISNLKAYLFIALKNNILKKLEQKRKFDTNEVDDNMLGEFNIEYSFQEQLIKNEISDELHSNLQHAILKLSPGQKEIVYLKFEEGLGYSEIAELMNISIESARKQLYGALQSLRQLLDNKSFTILLSIFRKIV